MFMKFRSVFKYSHKDILITISFDSFYLLLKMGEWESMSNVLGNEKITILYFFMAAAVVKINEENLLRSHISNMIKIGPCVWDVEMIDR